MSDSSIRTLCGLATTAANMRLLALGYDAQQQNLCRAYSSAFGLGESTGDIIYNQLSGGETNLSETIGFSASSTYASFEPEIKAIIDSFLPGETAQARAILTVAAQSVIFGYSICSSLDVSKAVSIMGAVLSQVSYKVNGTEPFRSTDDSYVIQPFSASVIRNLIKRDYASVISQINGSPQSVETQVVNYNWYDMSKVFAGPDLQIMKDVENQYYCVSGELIYKSAIDSLSPCQKETVIYSTVNGNVTGEYIKNVPCMDLESYIGPVTGVKFNRVFNDGPPSSGDFSVDVLSGYMGWDKKALDPKDYQGNYVSLLTFGNPLSLGSTFIDANGAYSLTQEYSTAPCSFDCTATYTKMHIGDNSPRVLCQYDGQQACIGGAESPATGWKFASLELKDDWDSYFANVATNPPTDTSRTLKRALNLNSNPYFATLVGDTLKPYTEDFNFNQFWYVGRPQLNGANTLPQVAFYQSFDNPTFGSSASVILYPSLGVANGDSAENSTRTSQVSSKPLASGVQSSDGAVEFNAVISSNLTGCDDIYKQFLGMGDAFSGQYKVSSFSAENAGFQYTGLLLENSNGLINPLTIIDSYASKILGSPTKEFQFISGYRTQFGTLSTHNIYGQDASGNLYAYEYFDPRLSKTAESIAVDNWSYFAPVPALYEQKFSRVTGVQRVENYLPRYSEGPYSVETRKLLYPNAAKAVELHQSQINGFPRKITFNVKVREETVREAYAIYDITQDGIVHSEPRSIKVLRPDNDPTALTLHSIEATEYMENLFQVDNDAVSQKYNFNHWKNTPFFYASAFADAVDNNFSPLYNGKVPSGKNNIPYGFYGGSPFVQGIRTTGDGATEYVLNSKGGLTSTGYSEAPQNYGLFHGYQYFESDVAINYVPPIYDMASGQTVVTDALLEAFPSQSLIVEDFNGKTYSMSGGMDPVFLELVGGRKGGASATQEGGYNAGGIIGDQWNGITPTTESTNYGSLEQHCQSNNSYTYYRYPIADRQFLMFAATPTGTTIIGQGLNYAPFFYDKTSPSFNRLDQYSFDYSLNGQPYTQLNPRFEGTGIYSFDAATYFPLKNEADDWYSASGFAVGPFDRDIEFGLMGGQTITPSGRLFINGRPFADSVNPSTECDYNPIFWEPNVAQSLSSYDEVRDSRFSILLFVPSGGTLNLNLQKNGIGKIGLTSPARFGFKARQPLYASTYHPYLHVGGQNMKDPFKFALNGVAPKFTIQHNGFNGLAGTHTFNNFSRSGIYYPTPGEDFLDMGSVDQYGNLIFQQGADVERYWRNYAKKNKVTVQTTGWREGSRISFEISNIVIENNVIPYQTYRVVSPSGTCTISGAMSYVAQADNCIFTEGVHLENRTSYDPMTGVYNPSFVSDTLKRIPQFSTPNGTLLAPVLKAPSMMIQREYVSGIEDGQEYVKLLNASPYNYNKLNWGALSDLETLNPGETLETLPPDDGNTFTTSSLMFSAAQGQLLPNGQSNPNISKTYAVVDQFQTYDSLSTDALLNSGACITSRRGQVVTITPTLLSGAIAPQGTPISLITRGLV
jgi:hypothetical protein